VPVLQEYQTERFLFSKRLLAVGQTDELLRHDRVSVPKCSQGHASLKPDRPLIPNMDFTTLFFLSSGLFLGWSLGANDAPNVFGTAVGSGMLKFRTAAIVGSIFIILGAMSSGSGAASTLATLGQVDAIAGAFVVALSAAAAVYIMIQSGQPVSTSQAIVGAILGWNLFANKSTNTLVLSKIAIAWVASPMLAGLIAVVLLLLIRRLLRNRPINLFRQDAYTRLGLLLAGAFGAYSLGANNIGNVMGVFIAVSPFTDFSMPGGLILNSTEQLFLLGGMAIAVGVFTYSYRIMLTIGRDLLPLTPIAAWVAVVAHSLVLFIFASQSLHDFLVQWHLPAPALVPVSSSQAIIGAVVGIGLLQGGSEVHWRKLGSIALGWVIAPTLAALLSFIALFFIQNVFNQIVYLH